MIDGDSLPGMEALSEKSAFAQRLLNALQNTGIETAPAVLAREFNRRYHGKSVSLYAARKWLLGEAIPAQDKLKLLASWLGVSAEWLRFGEPVKTVTELRQETMPYVQNNRLLFNDIALLNEAHQQAVRALVNALLEAERDTNGG